MKKLLTIFLALILVYSATLPAFCAEEPALVLASSGSTEYSIVISESASASEVTAANELSSYLKKITSADFPIVKDSVPEKNKEIVIGATNREASEPIDRSKMGDEGVMIFTKDQKLFLTGGTKRGAIYAVYTFLEDWLGCRWFTKRLTYIPESENLSIDSINYSYTPPFELRQTYWMFSTGYADYSAIHKIHGLMAYIPERLGGFNVDAVVNSVHTMQTIITADMFNEHPEYFGMDTNGSRSIYRQPCFSNEDVLDLTVAAAKKFFSQYSNVFSVSQNDGRDFCQCDKCKEFNAAHGNADSASLINFVNKVAVKVRKDYPNAKIETLAYQNSETPPTDIEIEENVIIRLCPIGTCVIHDLDDKSCPANAKFDKNFSSWSKITNNIYIWDYSTNFQYTYALYPNITSIRKRYQYFRDHNVIAIFDNGCGDNIVPGELHELRTYLICKLLWDPDTDVEKHIREFCKAYYGNAGDDVVKFINLFELLSKGSLLKKSHISCHDGGVNLNNKSAIGEIDAFRLDRIMKSAWSKDLDDDQKKHLEGLELSWRFYKNATWTGEFNWLSSFANPEKASKELYYDMKDYGITYLSEAGGLVLKHEEPNYCVLPTFWYLNDDELPPFEKLQGTILPIINRIQKIFFFLSFL